MARRTVILSDLTEEKIVELYRAYASELGMFEDLIDANIRDMAEHDFDRDYVVDTMREDFGQYLEFVD